MKIPPKIKESLRQDVDTLNRGVERDREDVERARQRLKEAEEKLASLQDYRDQFVAWLNEASNNG